jgi:alkyl sulfatase BDS1-like metallo-beta-lactamase superfamily hydrolase
VLDLEPELLLSGHDEPIRGAANIQAQVGKVRDAVRHIHDATIEGMNAGKPLHQVMAEVRLPEALAPGTGRGPVSWYVRAVWEEYVGWYRAESLTDLYPVPQRAVWPELAELAGIDALAERAAAHVAAGRPVEAMHLVEIAREADPTHRATLEAEVGALELLLERTHGETYDEMAWLEGELARASAALEG